MTLETPAPPPAGDAGTAEPEAARLGPARVTAAWAAASGPARRRAGGSCGNCNGRMFCDSSAAFLTFCDDNFHSCLRPGPGQRPKL